MKFWKEYQGSPRAGLLSKFQTALEADGQAQDQAVIDDAQRILNRINGSVQKAVSSGRVFLFRIVETEMSVISPGTQPVEVFTIGAHDQAVISRLSELLEVRDLSADVQIDGTGEVFIPTETFLARLHA
jgi:hypothetical protein